MPLNSHIPKLVITKKTIELAIAAAPMRSGVRREDTHQPIRTISATVA